MTLAITIMSDNRLPAIYPVGARIQDAGYNPGDQTVTMLPYNDPRLFDR